MKRGRETWCQNMKSHCPTIEISQLDFAIGKCQMMALNFKLFFSVQDIGNESNICAITKEKPRSKTC